MYDISGFGYDIRDVVRVLNLTVRRKSGRSYDVDCPFCNHKTGKLNINIEKNVFRCNYCDAHGGMLDLYSKLYNVTKAEANQQIREALNLGQYRDDYQRPERSERDLEPPAPVNSERASDMEIHQTYSQMLSMLKLSRKHQEDLQRRGLTPEQIEIQRYRSVPLFGISVATRFCGPIINPVACHGINRYNDMRTEKGKGSRTPAFSREPCSETTIKTMIIISKYEVEYKEEEDIFHQQ